MEHPYVYEGEYTSPRWQGNIQNSQWLEVLHLFAAVRRISTSSRNLCHVSHLPCKISLWKGRRKCYKANKPCRAISRSGSSHLGPVLKFRLPHDASSGHPILSVSPWERYVVETWKFSGSLSYLRSMLSTYCMNGLTGGGPFGSQGHETCVADFCASVLC